MAKKTKMEDFYKGNRREFTLTDYHVLMTSGEEKRFKLSLEMPISNKPLVAMPGWISNPWQEMEKADSLTTRSNIEVMLEGMTIDIFCTDAINLKELTATGVLFTGFHLSTSGEGEKKETVLNFVAYVPGSIQMRDWAWGNLRKTFFAEVAYSQSEITFDDVAEEEEDEEAVEATR